MRSVASRSSQTSPTTSSKPRRFAAVIAALALVTALSGCVVYPAGGYYGHGGGYYHHGWR